MTGKDFLPFYRLFHDSGNCFFVVVDVKKLFNLMLPHSQGEILWAH
jgi:hypothetical protein